MVINWDAGLAFFSVTWRPFQPNLFRFFSSGILQIIHFKLALQRKELLILEIR